MNMFQEVALFLNDDMYHEFKIALAVGHWRSGELLTPHQRKICQEVVSIREAFSFEQPETHNILQSQSFDEYVYEYMPNNTVH